MIVLDASAALALVLGPTVTAVRVDALVRAAASVHVPELYVLEIAQVLRRHLARGVLTDDQASARYQLLAELPDVVHAHGPFRGRVWALRHSLSSYDAVYMALAEALDIPLVTCDAGLARSPVGDAEVVHVR